MAVVLIYSSMIIWKNAIHKQVTHIGHPDIYSRIFTNTHKLPLSTKFLLSLQKISSIRPQQCFILCYKCQAWIPFNKKWKNERKKTHLADFIMFEIHKDHPRHSCIANNKKPQFFFKIIETILTSAGTNQLNT